MAAITAWDSANLTAKTSAVTVTAIMAVGSALNWLLAVMAWNNHLWRCYCLSQWELAVDVVITLHESTNTHYYYSLLAMRSSVVTSVITAITTDTAAILLVVAAALGETIRIR